MVERMPLYREQWGNSNLTKDLFRFDFDMLFSELYKIKVIKLLS